MVVQEDGCERFILEFRDTREGLEGKWKETEEKIKWKMLEVGGGLKQQQARAVRPPQESSLQRKEGFWALEKCSFHKSLWLASISSVKRRRKSRTARERGGKAHEKIK